MGQTPRDQKTEPSLELPSFPGLRRRKKSRKTRDEATSPPPQPEPEAEEGAPTEAAGAKEPLIQTAERPPQTGAVRKKVRAPRRTPRVPGRVAAALTGLVVGAAGAGGTYGALTACETVRGVSTCGGAPGFLILVVILVLMVLVGAGILKLFKVGDVGSTSFLAVGLVAVVVMLFLLDVVMSPWMFAVVPVLGALAFGLAHWVTTRFDDEKGRRDWT